MSTTAISEFAGGQSVIYNPKGSLDKDAFLKLLLTQLKYQDPTAPMETEKMLAQTADMAVIESQANIQKEMENMVTQFKQTSAFQLVGAVGKMADTGLNAIRFADQATSYSDLLYFEDDFENGLLSVLDGNGSTVKTINLAFGTEGLIEFNWDGTDEFGNKAPAGTYTFRADYTGLNTGKQHTTHLGVYPIESVVLDQSTPKLLLGGDYYTLDEIVAIKDRR